MFTAGAALGVGTDTCTVGTGGAGNVAAGRETRAGGVCAGGVFVAGACVVVCRVLVTRLDLSCGEGSAGAPLVLVMVGAMLGTAIFSPRHAGLASKGCPGMVVTKVFLSCK